jgi:hypothetical protein
VFMALLHLQEQSLLILEHAIFPLEDNTSSTS